MANPEIVASEDPWSDGDVAREYEELAVLEALGGGGADEGAPLVPLEAGPAARDLGTVMTLEERLEAGVPFTEGEATADRVARAFEGMELDAIEGLAHHRDPAGSPAFPDDDLGRELEALDP